ncbi:MAG: geranylgeranylglyceryl phosphate synthase [Candidatus Micrarchaeota archaeon]|nr:MAG: geranylgeranylglyceryl phosphate synthase [Candidatus Micrarchaeota archaeon]
MDIGKVERYILELLEEKKKLLFTVIDPLDYKDVDSAVKTAYNAYRGGADAILIGGSIGVHGEVLDNTAEQIKEKIDDTPLIIFPGNISTLTRHADAVYFMSLLNARNPYWIIQAQTLAAHTIRSLKLEPLPVGYIVVAPGGTVGWVGDANLVPREKPKLASILALAGQYLGNHFIITDTGSNPALQGQGHVPLEMIRAVKSTIDIPYIVAGGIRSYDEAKNVFKAGADIVQVGTAFEKAEDTYKAAKLFARAAREAAEER